MTVDPPPPRRSGDPSPPAATAEVVRLTPVRGSAVQGSAVPPSFEDLYQVDWRPVVALGWSLTGDRAVAEELAQDAFLAAYRRWDHVGGLERPGAWVRRAVANRAVDHHRRARVASTGADRLRSVEQVRRQVSSGDPADDPSSTDDVFWAAVRALPERQAQCVALHYLEDRAVDDIAAVLDCRPATVRVHLHRGRQALARSLGLASRAQTSEEEA